MHKACLLQHQQAAGLCSPAIKGLLEEQFADFSPLAFSVSQQCLTLSNLKLEW